MGGTHHPQPRVQGRVEAKDVSHSVGQCFVVGVKATAARELEQLLYTRPLVTVRQCLVGGVKATAVRESVQLCYVRQFGIQWPEHDPDWCCAAGLTTPSTRASGWHPTLTTLTSRMTPSCTC